MSACGALAVVVGVAVGFCVGVAVVVSFSGVTCVTWQFEQLVSLYAGVIVICQGQLVQELSEEKASVGSIMLTFCVAPSAVCSWKLSRIG